jgi:SAM-dependent methyltransferase
MDGSQQQIMDDVQFAAHSAHEDRHWWFTARREILLGIIGKLLSDEERRPLVLDVGSGTGATVAELAKKYRVIGVEPSAAAVRRAREKYPFCEFVEGSAPHAIGERIRDVRLVTMMDVLEHVADDYRLLADVVDACSPGTWFVLTVPADMSLWSEHDVVLGHYRRYDAQGLAALWQSLPVSCHLLAPLNRRLEPVVRFVRTIRPPWLGRRGAAGTDLALPAEPLNQFLHRVFAGESQELLKGLDEHRVNVRGKGVSLVAVLRREPSDSAVVGKGADRLESEPHEIVVNPRRPR